MNVGAKIMLTGKNIGTSPAYLGNLVLFMMDSNDRKFQPIMNFDFGNNARTYLGGEFSNSELQPGFTGKYYSVFEVSPESTELSLMIGDGRDQNYRIQLQ